MIITETERAQLLGGVHENILKAIDGPMAQAANVLQIAANNLFALIDQATVGTPEAQTVGIPVADVAAIRDALTKLIDADVPPPPPPPPSGASPDGATITAPTTDKITDAAGHVWTFGTQRPGDAHYPGPDYFILRDGQSYFQGASISLTIKANVMYARTSPNRWSPNGTLWKDNGGGWDLIEGQT
jgi:hypothetical protein